MPGTRINGFRSGGSDLFPVFLVVIFFFLCLPVYALTKQTDSCTSLLGLKFSDRLPAEEQKYLGTDGKNPFSLKDIKGTIFVIEVFSTYCLSCPRDVPVINEVYTSVRDNSRLRDNVRVFSIAIGNTKTEIEGYKKEFKILYPVLTDYNFVAHKALGDPYVPITLIIRKTSTGRCIIDYSHQGVLTSAETVLNTLKSGAP